MTSRNIIMIAWVIDEFGLCIWINEPCRLILIHIVFGTSDKIQRRYCRKFWEITYDYDNPLLNIGGLYSLRSLKTGCYIWFVIDSVLKCWSWWLTCRWNSSGGRNNALLMRTCACVHVSLRTRREDHKNYSSAQ